MIQGKTPFNLAAIDVPSLEGEAHVGPHRSIDGNVVDLNRIPLPLDTQIVDERFKRH